MEEYVLTLDDVEYHFTADDVFKTQKIANRLLGMAKGVVALKVKDLEEGGFDVDIDPIAMLNNMDGPEVEAAQEFILNTLQIVSNGEAIPFKNKSDRSLHFGKYRSHLYQVLLAGGKYHFTPFIPTGEEFAKSTIGQVINKALANIPK